jgi:site-specific recombinase XerD
MRAVGTLPALLQGFFTKRLMSQRQASPHTISAYRDTFRLLLRFAETHTGKPPSRLLLSDLNGRLVADFLDDLEKTRGNKARSRNARLTAIRSFFHYAAYEEPGAAADIQHVLSIPRKRYSRALVSFLSREEIEALLSAPDQKTWSGRRDHILILVAVQTGLRVSELTGLCRENVRFGDGTHIRCVGKGRKERATPLTRNASAILRAWLDEPANRKQEIVFPSARGKRLSTDGVQYLLDKHAETAVKTCALLGSRRITPHVLRHSNAMELLQAGVDRGLIAIWLGHESVETTQIYLDANMTIKEDILARAAPAEGARGRFCPDDSLLKFLTEL